MFDTFYNFHMIIWECRQAEWVKQKGHTVLWYFGAAEVSGP